MTPAQEAAERARLTDTGGWGPIPAEAERLNPGLPCRVKQVPVVMNWAALDWSRSRVGMAS